jgi:hypothetical protein
LKRRPPIELFQLVGVVRNFDLGHHSSCIHSIHPAPGNSLDPFYPINRLYCYPNRLPVIKITSTQGKEHIMLNNCSGFPLYILASNSTENFYLKNKIMLNTLSVLLGDWVVSFTGSFFKISLNHH